MELLLLLGMSLGLGFMVLGNDGEDTDNSAHDVPAGDDTEPPDPVDDTETSSLTLADLAGPLPEPAPSAERPSGEETDGDDVIYANDEFYDMYNAGAGDDVVFGGDVGDVIRGGDGDDTLFGGGGNDQLSDDEGHNVLDGGAGDDVIQVTHGSIAAGGEGADIYQLDLDTLDGAPAIITDFNADEDVIELVVLETDAADIGELTGAVWDDGAGIDLYLGETLMAKIAGGQDIDPSALTVYVNATGDAVQDTSDDGAVIRAWGADQTIAGGAGDDTISSWIAPGDSGADAFFGEDGDDVLEATGAGNSTYVLEGEDIQLTEMATLDGGAGDDTLIGTDTVVMTGGAGADAFGVSQQSYYGNVVEPTVITDFVQGEDILYVDYRYLDPYSDGSEAELEIVVWDDGTGADIVVGDQVVAKVTGGQDLTPDEIVTGQGIEADLLGPH